MNTTAHTAETLIQSICERMERIEKLLVLQNKETLTAEEAGLVLGLSAGHVNRLARARLIPHYRHGRNIYYNKAEIQAALLQERYASEAEIQQAQKYKSSCKT